MLRLVRSVCCLTVVGLATLAHAQTPKINATAPTSGPLVLTPSISSMSPTTRKHGEILKIAGSHLKGTFAVTFIDSKGNPWPAQSFSVDPTTKELKVVIPVIPHQGYTVKVTTSYGTATAAGTLNIAQKPIASAPTASKSTKIKTALAKIVSVHQREKWISATGAQTINSRANAGEFKSIGEALDAEADVMLKEAEAAVGGPVSDSVILVAVKTGKSPTEIAKMWRHCHSPQVGIGGPVQAKVGIATPTDQGKVLGGCGTDAKYHAHIVPVGINNAATYADAIKNGTAPPSIPSHLHTEKSFPSGEIYYAPMSDDGWFAEGMSMLLKGGEWLADHSDTVFSSVKIILYGTGIVLSCIATAGVGCVPAALAGGAKIAKEVTRILIDEEVIEVPGGVSKATALKALDATG
jgi:hypothetical protein